MWLRNKNKKNPKNNVELDKKTVNNQESRNLHNKVKAKQHMDTLVGSNTIVSGNIDFHGGLHIDGQVNGNVSSGAELSSLLVVGNSAKIIGDVKVERAVINGYICGNLYVYEHLELGENAVIMGDVHYNLIEMSIGSEVRGGLLPDIKKEPRSLLEDHSRQHQDKDFGNNKANVSSRKQQEQKLEKTLE